MTLALVQQQEIGINQEWLDEWIEYRREDCKKKMTPRAVRMLTKRLLAYDEATQARLICHAISQEWTDVHCVEPPKEQITRSTTLLHDLTSTDWANN